MSPAVMCLACHGDINPNRQRGAINPRARFCTDAGGLCRSAWYKAGRPGGSLSARCIGLRAVNAYRRELMAAEACMARLIGVEVAV